MAPVEIEAAHFSPDTRTFVRLLHEHGVRYLIVGGEAVIFHGHLRLTGDVDFFFDRSADNAERLFRALEAFWDGDVPGIASAEELTAGELIVQFGQPPNRIDLLNTITAVTFADAWATRVEAVMVDAAERTPIPYIGVDALVKNKRASGRPKDLDDLAYLEPGA